MGLGLLCLVETKEENRKRREGLTSSRKSSQTVDSNSAGGESGIRSQAQGNFKDLGGISWRCKSLKVIIAKCNWTFIGLGNPESWGRVSFLSAESVIKRK